MSNEGRKAATSVRKRFPFAVAFRVPGDGWEIRLTPTIRMVFSSEQRDEESAWLTALDLIERHKAVR